ncbi:MAG: flippase-like domain-containing protein [Chloroflexi bacterium]|nr:flippase-like domain-containing protein [Chloroflexota bacterium]
MASFWWWQGLKVAVSATLLGLLLSRVEPAQMGAVLGAARPDLLALAFGATVAAWALNTLKWQRLLRELGQQVAFRRLLALNYIGIFYALVLPGQVSGEVMKGLRLAQAGGTVSSAAVSIGVDRLTGTLALGVLGVLGLALAPAVAAGQAMLWVAGGATVLAGGFLAFLATRAPAMLSGKLAIIPLRRAREGAQALAQSLSAYRRSPWALSIAFFQAVGFQALVTLSNYLAAVGVGVEIPPAALLWIVATVSLLHMAPISFAGLGIREGAYVLLLHQYGVPLVSGASLALTVSGIILLQGIIGGVLEALAPRVKVATS